MSNVEHNSLVLSASKDYDIDVNYVRYVYECFDEIEFYPALERAVNYRAENGDLPPVRQL